MALVSIVSIQWRCKRISFTHVVCFSDFQVLPPLQGMGIGQKIVNRILRVLTSRGIYDISALCSEEERLFFKACGFGDDILESTTMMYTRTISPGKENQTVHQVGQKQFLVPPQDKKSFKTWVWNGRKVSLLRGSAIETFERRMWSGLNIHRSKYIWSCLVFNQE